MPPVAEHGLQNTGARALAGPAEAHLKSSEATGGQPKTQTVRFDKAVLSNKNFQEGGPGSPNRLTVAKDEEMNNIGTQKSLSTESD